MIFNSPHLCVGFLFLVLYPAVRLPSASRPPPVVRLHTFHTQLVHTQLVLTPLAHATHLTQFGHTQLAHTHVVITQLFNLSSHNLSSHNLSTRNLPSQTQLTHTLSSYISHSLFTHLVITQLVITQLVHTQLALTDTTHAHLVFTHLAARMAAGWLRWRAWAGVERGDAAAVGVAGVALGDIPSFHVAGVVLGDIDFHFCVAAVARMALGWLRWRAWAGVERGDAAAVGVACVAHGDIHFVSRGRRGAWWHRLGKYLCSITCIHTDRQTYIHPTQLVHTQLTHIHSSTHNLLHTNPSPSLFSFLLSPCHLYLSFAACWKKLTCGV